MIYQLDAVAEGVFAPLVACWRAMRREGERLPDRAALTPARLGPILDYVHFLEWVDPPDDIRYRVSGAAELARLGSASLGENYIDHLDEHAADYCRRWLHRLNSHPCGTLIASEEYGRDGRVRMTRYLTLPMLCGERGRLQVMSQVDTREEVGVFGPEVMCALSWRDRLTELTPVDLGFGVPAGFEPFAPAEPLSAATGSAAAPP
ncbi:MAG: hypothetical protein RIB45_03395 [Marivibrio sp.]|uniref:hypothetical protein n=1 Tax=Marivibrio sp. TaxID=2039719 RepID=UPI0032EC3A1B